MTATPELASRLERVRAAMAGRGVEAMLLTAGKNLPYLTGYESVPMERPTVAIVSADDVVVVVPELEAPRVDPRAGLLRVRSWAETEDPLDIVAGNLGGMVRVAVGDETRASVLLGMQRRLPATDFIEAGPVVAPLRLRKTPAEIELLRRAGAAADRVASRLADVTFSGRAEADLAREIAAMIVEEGHDAPAFTIVASGPNAASPHHEPGERAIAPGDTVVVDFGGTIEGYHSDTTRTFHVGPPSDEALEVHRLVQAAQQAAFEVALEGATAASVDAAARARIVAAGYGTSFIHRTGHGIGLDVHEEPYLVEGNQILLEPAMVFSIEPGIYLPGRLGVRIEDIVVLTAAGPDRLNESNRDPVIVG